MDDQKKMSSQSFRRDQTFLAKTIGTRLREARELCNLTQTTAAKKLGYKNSSKLAKIERASDTRSVPLWLILRAAQLYEVSIDFLFGLSDDWETDARKTQERMVSPWIAVLIEKRYTTLNESLYKLNNRLQKITDTIMPLTDSVLECEQTLEDFRAANPWFDNEARLGAKFVRKIEAAANLSRESKSELKRFERECYLAKNPAQLNLFENNNAAAK